MRDQKYAIEDFSEIAKALKVLEGTNRVDAIREPKFWPIPLGQKAKEFSNKQLVAEWGTVYRIKNGSRLPHRKWCMENLKSDWSCSHGDEVYYFRDHNDASLFKLIHS